MQNFNRTLTLLNGLIEKLQANTGGQNLDVKLQRVSGKQTKKQNQAQKPTKSQKKQQKKQEGDQQKKEKKDKKDKKKEQKKVQKKQEEKKDGEIGVDTFAQIDIRIGNLVQCWKHPESEKLYCEKIDIGFEIRQIASGLQELVPIQNMKDLVLVMANLKPRPLAKFMSNGMLICAQNSEGSKVSIIRPDGKIGQRIYLDGYQELFKSEGVLPVMNPKRKILQKCSEFFKTDEEGYIVWKGIRLRTAAGYLKTDIVSGVVR